MSKIFMKKLVLASVMGLALSAASVQAEQVGIGVDVGGFGGDVGVGSRGIGVDVGTQNQGVSVGTGYVGGYDNPYNGSYAQPGNAYYYYNTPNNNTPYNPNYQSYSYDPYYQGRQSYQGSYYNNNQPSGYYSNYPYQSYRPTNSSRPYYYHH